MSSETSKVVNKKLGDMVQSARDAKGWTQRELAKRLGRSAGYVGQLESGRIGLPGLEVIDALEQHLGMNPEDIMRTTGRLKPASGLDIMAELRRIRALPDEQTRVQELKKLPLEVVEMFEEMALDIVRQQFAQQLRSTATGAGNNDQT